MDLVSEARPEGQPVLQEEGEMVRTLCCCQLPSTPSWRSASCAVPCSFFKGGGLAGVGLGETRGALVALEAGAPERQGRSTRADYPEFLPRA